MLNIGIMLITMLTLVYLRFKIIDYHYTTSILILRYLVFFLQKKGSPRLDLKTS